MSELSREWMKCIACGEPMPDISTMAWAANAMSPMPAPTCKCGSTRFHGTFTTGKRALSQPPDSEAVRLLNQILFQMEMENWHWNSEASTSARRDAVANLKKVIAHLARQAGAQPDADDDMVPNGWEHYIDMIYFCKCRGFLGIRHSDVGLYWKCSQCDFSEPVEMPSICRAQTGQPAAREPEGTILPAMDRELEWILGRPNFACVSFARALEKSGQTIEHKAEAEQAAAIYWMLGLYLKHGAGKWRDEAEAEMKAMLRASSPAEGEKK